MELVIKKFEELTVDELWEIYHLRTSIFVVEQKCAYLEVDEYDKVSYHIWLKDEDGIAAYARVLPAHTTFDTPSIGRLLSKKRRMGLGSKILSVAIDIAKDKFEAEKITIEAQTYARTLYEKAGFVQTSGEFLDEGIPHIQMQLAL